MTGASIEPMAAERRGGGGGGGLCIPIVGLPLPNPLAWVPRPRLLGGGGGSNNNSSRKRGQSGAPQALASASVAMGDTVLSSAAAASSSAAAAASSPAPAPKVALKPASDVLCGALARAASQSTIHPLDTLKVRLQARARTVVNTTTSTQAATILPPGVSKFGQLVPPGGARGGGGRVVPRFDAREAGRTVASLYKGVFGAASGAGIAIGAYFAFYGAACNLVAVSAPDMPPGSVAFISGAVAAVGSSVVKVPLAVCIRSVQAGVYPNVAAAGRSIVAAAGPRGLFTGWLPTLLEDVPDMAIKFAAYESMRQVHSKFHKGRKATPQEDFAMGAVAGSLAAAATTPLDVIKTNMMCSAAQRPSMAAAARLVAAQGGGNPAAFFRGVGPRALSNGINSAVFFAFFEALRGLVANVKRAQAAGNGGTTLQLITASLPRLPSLPLPPPPALASTGSSSSSSYTHNHHNHHNHSRGKAPSLALATVSLEETMGGGRGGGAK